MYENKHKSKLTVEICLKRGIKAIKRLMKEEINVEFKRVVKCEEKNEINLKKKN